MVLPLSRQKHKRSRSEGGIDDVAAKKRFRKNREDKGRKSTSALGFSPSPKKTIGSRGKINISLDGEESVDLTKKDWERYKQLKAVGWTHVISPQATPESESVRPRMSSLTKLSEKERHMIRKLQSGKRDTSPFRKSARKIGKRKLPRPIAMGVPENSLFVPTHNPSEGNDPNFISIKPSPAHRLPKVRKGLHKLKVADANKVETINIEMEVPVKSLRKKRLKKLQAQNDDEDDPVVISISPPAHKLSKKARKRLNKFQVTNINEEMSNSEMEVSANSLIVPPVIQEPENVGENSSILASDTQKLSNKQKKRMKKLQAQNQIEEDDPVVISVIPPALKLPKKARKGLHKLKITIANEKDPSNSNGNAPTVQLLSKKKKKRLHKLDIADEEESSNINGNVPTMQRLFKKAKKTLYQFEVTNINAVDPSNNNSNVPPMQQLSTKAKEAVMKQQKRLEAEGKRANGDRATNGGEGVVMAEESDGEKAAKTTPKTKRLLTRDVSIEDAGGKKRRLSAEVDTKKEKKAALETKVNQQPKKKRFVLFVGQLPLTSTDVDVRSHFSSAGTATSIRLMRDKQTNQSRGMAFVEFDNKEAYEKGLSLNHTFLGGRRINVEYTHNGRSHEGRAKMRHKNLKLQAMRHTGKLRGSKPASGKRSARRAKMRNANKPR